jgi:hypothetical protein
MVRIRAASALFPLVRLSAAASAAWDITVRALHLVDKDALHGAIIVLAGKIGAKLSAGGRPARQL